MKHLKNFESSISDKLISYQMYKYNESILSYIGNNGSNYSLLCLIFNKNNLDVFYFIDWSSWVGNYFEPLNIDINDYIIQNSIVNLTLKSINKKNFSSGPDGIDNKLISKLKKHVLSNERVIFAIDAEKYNI